MPQITFKSHDGGTMTIEASPGSSLMEVAKNNDVPGMVAECGGACACATCHVYIDEAYLTLTGRLTDCEAPMLEFLDDARPNSRLACQVRITDALDGLVVTTPQSQY